jgi:CelD/BcsL family acetyltransferase involved in cellulose biosynthesis
MGLVVVALANARSHHRNRHDDFDDDGLFRTSLSSTDDDPQPRRMLLSIADVEPVVFVNRRSNSTREIKIQQKKRRKKKKKHSVFEQFI